MRIELDVFSGRPNPAWSLTGEQAAEVLARFRALEPSDSPGALFDGLGYRGFKIAGFEDHDEVTVRAEVVEASRGGTRRRWLDEGRGLERYLLETSKPHLDPDLYRMIAATIETR